MEDQGNLFAGHEPPLPPPRKDIEPVWIKSRVHGKALKIGRLCAMPRFEARSRDLEAVSRLLSGKVIFYREQKQAHDFVSFVDKSIGCDKAAWDEAARRGCEYMVTLALRERRLYVVHVSHVNRTLDLGRGIQSRAKLRLCNTYENCDPLPVPVTKKAVVVEGIP